MGKRHARGYGFTFGAMGSLRNNFYKNAFARQGFADEVNEVQRLWMAGERDKARDHVPVELALKANLIGTPAMIQERIAIYRDAGINTLSSRHPEAMESSQSWKRWGRLWIWSGRLSRSSRRRLVRRTCSIGSDFGAPLYSSAYVSHFF